MDRDPALYNEASETPDMADLDSPAEVLAEEIMKAMPWRKLTTREQFCLQAATISIQMFGAQEAPVKAKEVLTRILCEIIDSASADDAVLTAKCYDFVFGLGIQRGASQTLIAEQHGVTRATVSRRCRLIVSRFAALGIKPGPGMKSEAAVQVYAERERSKPKRVREAFRFEAAIGKFNVKETV